MVDLRTHWNVIANEHNRFPVDRGLPWHDENENARIHEVYKSLEAIRSWAKDAGFSEIEEKSHDLFTEIEKILGAWQSGQVEDLKRQDAKSINEKLDALASLLQKEFWMERLPVFIYGNDFKMPSVVGPEKEQRIRYVKNFGNPGNSRSSNVLFRIQDSPAYRILSGTRVVNGMRPNLSAKWVHGADVREAQVIFKIPSESIGGSIWAVEVNNPPERKLSGDRANRPGLYLPTYDDDFPFIFMTGRLPGIFQSYISDSGLVSENFLSAPARYALLMMNNPWLFDRNFRYTDVIMIYPESDNTNKLIQNCQLSYSGPLHFLEWAVKKPAEGAHESPYYYLAEKCLKGRLYPRVLAQLDLA